MSDGEPAEKTKAIQVGDPIDFWHQLAPITPYLHLQAPPVEDTDPNSPPDQTKYPGVAGVERLSVTESAKNIRKRSWMGWFLWGDGTPPPGTGAGEASTQENENAPWDFCSWQYSAGYDVDDVDNNNGRWKPVRLDQQPLYLNPLRINYNWPAGKFGYRKQPLKDFADNLGYWSEKKIVRGPNLSLAYPYLVEYADYVDKTKNPNFPDEWRNSWLYVRTRPLETLVIVPGVKSPSEILADGPWNQVGHGHEPFPYPVWDETLPAAEQTPFNIKVDRMGDWDADLVWEGTHAGAKDYEKNRYRRTDFNEPGQGNYLKMTVAQGSPFIWCETHRSRYVSFYNLIRTNEKGHIDNTGGTRPSNAGMAREPVLQQTAGRRGAWDVPGVDEVQYVLLYGNQTNPNQFYHEVEPFKWDRQTGQPGGWNPPGHQSNHTYMAVYFRKSAVVPVDLDGQSAIDIDGNPYFFLKFNNSDRKNWFVVGAVPVMSYYHSQVPEDDEQRRLAAARRWAEEMGRYAFNFLVDTKISFKVTNIYKATTTYKTVVQNPYVAAGEAAAAGMTADPQKTVIALMPHHYQPITLGPDLTQSIDPPAPDNNQVIWRPLQTLGADLPVYGIDLPNANKSDPDSGSRWGYWSPRGNLRTLATAEFDTDHLFQNFLPLMPPPQWDREYPQTSIQGVRVHDIGTGYERLPTDFDDPPESALPSAGIVSATGSGAQLKVILQPHTDKIQQIDVVSGGAGYPDGNPPAEVSVKIGPPSPKIPGGRVATARAQVAGGKVLAVFMIDQGAGYRSTIQLKAAQESEVGSEAPIILPVFTADGNQLETGLARVITGGAGWVATDQAPDVELRGTGTGAKAEIVRPGQIIRIADPGIGGFVSHGTYPSIGNPQEEAKKIKVHLGPSARGQAQQARVGSVEPTNSYFKTVITDPGEGYTTPPLGDFTSDDGQQIEMINIILSNKGGVITADPKRTDFKLNKPIEVNFRVQAGHQEPKRKAEAKLLPGFSIGSVVLDGEACSGYEHDLEIAFSGGDVGREDFVMPELDFDIENGEVKSVRVKNKGKGFYRDGFFTIEGGKGFNAALRPVLSEGNRGELIAVKVLRPGSNYIKKVRAYTDPGKKELDVEISQDGKNCIVNVSLRKDVDYSGFGTIPSIFLTALAGKELDYVNYPAKGNAAKITFSSDAEGGITNVKIEKGDSGERYLPGTANQATAESLPAIPRFSDLGQVASANQAYGFIAEVARSRVKVEQVLYDSLISRFSTMATKNLRPFGGSFGGGSAPDGYGLGNNLSAAAKVLGVLYNLQQRYAKGKDLPSVTPSLFAVREADNTENKFEFPIYARNHPLLTLSGSLKTMTQALQRTLTLFFQEKPYTNAPAAEDWVMAYFSQYDKAGRVVVNPTSTNPVYGVVSSIRNPPPIPAAKNQGKKGLKAWKPGKLWSGFGVSDQWNDQHYFYGYYLSTAALLALLDGSWGDAKPEHLWADVNRMGTAIDQWVKTLAYDPALDAYYYDYQNACKTHGISYEKYSFFDQWNGHPWATGVSPGRAGDVEDGRKRGPTPWSIWSSKGTGSFPYDDENENSTWEGLQAYSAIILWGAATQRKAIVDQGIYLLTTGNAASDLYFLDKNYNLKRGPKNRHTWCPVTTGTPASNKSGGNTYATHTGFVDSNPKAFYGEASAGCSILHKGSPSLNNFFYAYPTGSKFIQAYPPTPWTMGMSRNLDYMRKWAEALTRPEWAHARDSSLFQPGNWLGMAMASALCGVPYSPGDDSTRVRPYIERLWSSWDLHGQEPGSQATMQPAEQPTSVLAFLHMLDEYGPPDWRIYARAVKANGDAADDAIVFTAAFSKPSPVDPSLVITTYVAFNPGWGPCRVVFSRVRSDGTLSVEPIPIRRERGPLEVPPKKMVVATRIAVRPDMALATEGLEIGSVAVLSDGAQVGVGTNSECQGQLFRRELPDDSWEATLKTAVAVTSIVALPVDRTYGQSRYARDALIGVSSGDLYVRTTVFEPWVPLPVIPEKVETITVAADGTLYGTTADGRLLSRGDLAAGWESVASADIPMRSIAVLPSAAGMLGIGREGEHEGALFRKTAVDKPWQRDTTVHQNTLASLTVDYAANKLVVSGKRGASALALERANATLANSLPMAVAAATEPQPDALANTNPNFYSTKVEETDPVLKKIFSRRTLFYHTGDQPLFLGQDSNLKVAAYAPDDTHLTVCALNLSLAGAIKIPRGDVRIYCGTLTVENGLSASIDVSPKEPEKQDLAYRTVLAAAAQTGAPGTSGQSGAAHNQIVQKQYGEKSATGGSITVICDRIILNGNLELKASGGSGYPGADGQDGVAGADGSDGQVSQSCRLAYIDQWSDPQEVCDPERVDSTATRGHPGGSGGDALKGGDGGDGGSISIRHKKLDGPDKLRLNAKGGAKGASGKPGNGARGGRGGKNRRVKTVGARVETSLLSQEYPTDADALPVSPRGRAVADTDVKPGKNGEEKTDALKDLAELGDVMHDMFLLMVLQSIKYRYLNCNPESFSVPTIKAKTREYTFFPGSKTEWTNIGKSLDWLTSLLAKFQNKPSGYDLSAIRKYQVQAQAASFTLKYNDHKTFYGDPANWVPRQTFKSIKDEFNANIKALKALQTEFLTLAKSYENADQKALTKKEYNDTLTLQQAYHLTAFETAASKITQARDTVDAAHGSFISAREKLSTALHGLEDKIAGHFQCRPDVIIKGVEMMAFAHGSLETAALMAGAELTSFITEGMNNLKLADGRVEDKKYLLQQIVGLGADLRKDFSEKLLQDGNLKFDDTTTLRFMADLDKLDAQIDSVSDVLGDVTDAKAKVMDFRNALAARSDAILAYNAVINTALKYRQDYEDDTKKLDDLNKAPTFDPYDMVMFSYYTQQYQEELDKVLNLLYRARRVAAYSDPSLGTQLDNYWKDWTALWTANPPDASLIDNNAASLGNQFVTLESQLTDDFAGSTAAYTPFPENEPTQGRIVLSEFVAALPAALVETLKTKKKVSFTLVSAGFPDWYLKTLENPVQVSNSSEFYNLRISHFRPYLTGAKTDSGKIRIDLKNVGMSIIDTSDKKKLVLSEFSHNPVNESFTHKALSEFPSKGAYEPPQEDTGGKLSDEILGLIGLLGHWTISVPDPVPTDPLDTNKGLDLSQLKEVRIYFKGYRRKKEL